MSKFCDGCQYLYTEPISKKFPNIGNHTCRRYNIALLDDEKRRTYFKGNATKCDRCK